MARWRKRVAIGVFLCALVAAAWLFGPFGDRDFSATPNPAVTYEDALSRIGLVQAAENTPIIAERGRSIALVHGSKTATSVVIFHGFTACPKPFTTIARGYYDAGYNVWVPRAPEHGYADYLTEAPANITATGLRDYADDAVDVAVGLGEHVEVVGLSGGGTLAMWAIVERPEVERAVAISPLLHPKTGLPVWQMRPLGRLAALGLLRGMWRWWDPVLKGSPERQLIDPNPYPRGNVNAMLEYLSIGRWLRDSRTGEGPPAGALTLVVNEHDPNIDDVYNVDTALALMDGQRIRTVEIPDREGLGHDLVDPQGENRTKIRASYFYLGEALGVRLGDPLAQK